MRPARKGPENLVLSKRGPFVVDGFNEAGPQGAGKPLHTLNGNRRFYKLQ